MIQFLSIHIFIRSGTFFDALNNIQSRLYAYIRRNQHFFQIIQHFVIYL